MLVLALESATEVAGVALADESGVLAAVTVGRGRRHGESIAPGVGFVCDRAGVTPADVEALSVDVGPGLFTGLRVGVSTAKALGFALGVPVVEVGSLELLARAVAGSAWAEDAAGSQVVAVIDARRAQLFSASFRLDPPAPSDACPRPTLVRLSEDRLLDPETLAAEVAAQAEEGRPCLCVGDGAQRYLALLSGVGARVASGYRAPDVGVLAAMGVDRAAAGHGRPAGEVAARYLRPADVRINWEQRATVRPAAGS